MTENTKRISLLFQSGALVALILLAASLSNLQLDSGRAFPGGTNSGGDIEADKALLLLKTYTFPMLEGLLALIFIALGVYLAARIILSVNIRVIIRLAAGMAIVLSILYLMRYITLTQPAFIPEGILEFAAPPADHYSVAPLGPPPPILIWLVVLGIFLGISIPAIIFVKQQPGRTRIEDALLHEAQGAVNAINAGESFRNVIVRCYMQMAVALKEEQGIERDFTMTVREFEGWLVSMGFPTVPVRQLTGLFEKVRYGEGQLGENDEESAIQSLKQVIEYCRSRRV